MSGATGGSNAQGAAYLAAVAAAERLYADPAELSAFMTARLDEDEAAANAAPEKHWFGDGGYLYTAGGDNFGEAWVLPPHPDEYEKDEATAAHIGRHDPARILTEVAVKREHLRKWVEQRATLKDVYANPSQYLHDQKIALVGGVAMMECVVRMDAAVYKRHPDFKPAWRLP